MKKCFLLLEQLEFLIFCVATEIYLPDFSVSGNFVYKYYSALFQLKIFFQIFKFSKMEDHGLSSKCLRFNEYKVNKIYYVIRYGSRCMYEHIIFT